MKFYLSNYLLLRLLPECAGDNVAAERLSAYEALLETVVQCGWYMWAARLREELPVRFPSSLS